MIATVFVMLSSLMYSLQLQSGSFPKPLTAQEERHYLQLATQGDPDCETVLDQLYQAYAESHESDPPEIRNGFKELDNLLSELSLEDNNAVWNLCCQLCTAYEHKAFLDGLQYGAHFVSKLFNKVKNSAE